MALFPSEACGSISKALCMLFEMPEAQHFFAFATVCQRAECAARHLCGLPPLWEVHAEERLLSPPRKKTQTEIRILLTGCFDLMHAGHYNALRQAKAAFMKEGYDRVHLVAGVHSDAAIAGQKGPPVIPHGERVELVEACKWVDEVAADLPYAVPVKLLDDLRVDFAVHGDDLPKVGGGGLFDEVMQAGRLKIVKRTEGMSTTELIGRLMSMSREHQIKASTDSQALVSELSPEGQVATRPILLPTVSRMVDFRGPLAADTKGGLAGRRVVYVPGAWDLFHVGHVRFLQQAAKHGDYILVGALTDDDVNKRIGRNFPLQTLHERALSLLSCRHVDDVMLGSPWKITQDMITTMNISVVCHGNNDFWKVDGTDCRDLGDAFEVPRKLNMLVKVDSGCEVTVHLLAHRIWKHAEEFAIRQQKKESEEKRYSDNKEFVEEA